MTCCYLQEQAKNLHQQHLTDWGQKARLHWKRFLPNLYAGLVTSGDLEAALLLAQEKAKAMFARLVSEQGMDQFQAEELATNEYLYLTPESEQAMSQDELSQLITRSGTPTGTPPSQTAPPTKSLQGPQSEPPRTQRTAPQATP